MCRKAKAATVDTIYDEYKPEYDLESPGLFKKEERKTRLLSLEVVNAQNEMKKKPHMLRRMLLR